MALSVTDLVELGDIDELLREIDRLSERRDWPGMVDLRERCALAVQRGKQLWGVAAHAAYRLALEAPGSLAGPVIDADVGPFTLGPLPEVAASTHSWAELRPHLPPGPGQGITAYERVVRGEDLTDDPIAAGHVEMFELPLTLQPWEPAYPVAEYKSGSATFPHPAVEPVDRRRFTETAWTAVHEPDAVRALLDVTRTWVSESDGRASAVAVEGGAAEGLSAAAATPCEAVRVSAGGALAVLAWAGAGGGVHGRRSGMAAGRSKAWWAAAAIAGVLDAWPDPVAIGRRIERLEWWTWSPVTGAGGWSLQLVVVDPDDDVTFVLDARDPASVAADGRRVEG